MIPHPADRDQLCDSSQGGLCKQCMSFCGATPDPSSHPPWPGPLVQLQPKGASDPRVKPEPCRWPAPARGAAASLARLAAHGELPHGCEPHRTAMAVQGWSWRHAGGSDVSAHLPAGQDTGQCLAGPVPRKQLQWLLTLRSESKDSPKLVATVRRPSRPRPSLSTQLMAAAVGSLLLPPTPTAVSRDCSQTQRPETGSACRLGPWSGLLAGMLLEADGAAQFGVGAVDPSRHITGSALQRVGVC